MRGWWRSAYSSLSRRNGWRRSCPNGTLCVMAGLPSGTVTFLFVDLEGSTRQWEEHREAMVGARARYYAILDDAVAGSRGVVFSYTGDGIAAAFVSATD